MRTLRGFVVCWLWVLITIPAGLNAQSRDEEDFGRGMQGIFARDWNLFVNGGITTSGRLMLQSPIGGGERALRTEDGFNLGAGVGLDVMPQTGLRLSYTYNSANLAFRTDNGDGSNALDVDNVGRLRSHVAAIEVVRYMLSARASITPYGSAGFVAAWWELDDQSTFVAAPSGSTQLRFGAVASIGLQLRLAERVSVRFEAASSTVRNPFTGNESFQALGGATIDEPTRVNRTDFRAVAIYHFGNREDRWPGRSRGRRRW